ncbi:hypothetical protein C8Q73DRAFT_112863 [Cubamyces lactineus]|nr:hypothetical protein C8Q73DRAFT_112863 [Cubamyces lactineus]
MEWTVAAGAGAVNCGKEEEGTGGEEGQFVSDGARIFQERTRSSTVFHHLLYVNRHHHHPSRSSSVCTLGNRRHFLSQSFAQYTHTGSVHRLGRHCGLLRGEHSSACRPPAVPVALRSECRSMAGNNTSDAPCARGDVWSPSRSGRGARSIVQDCLALSMNLSLPRTPRFHPRTRHRSSLPMHEWNAHRGQTAISLARFDLGCRSLAEVLKLELLPSSPSCGAICLNLAPTSRRCDGAVSAAESERVRQVVIWTDQAGVW